MASFFPSIDKQTFYDIIARRVRDPELRWLTRTILFHDLATDYRFKRGPGHTPPPTSSWYSISKEKSLFGKQNERGLPIGNLTSQFGTPRGASPFPACAMARSRLPVLDGKAINS